MNVACLRIRIIGCLLACPGIVSAALDLPPPPAEPAFVHDLGRMLPAEAKQQIGIYQKRAFERHQTPIVVVTIDSMAEYGGEGYSIERFASEWFNHWQIGARGEAGELINRGILLLVSRNDRQARIELGNDWGRRWDAHAARIMDQRIIPRFKQDDFGGGIVAGVEALETMAALGPEAEPPGGLSRFRPESLREKPLITSPLPAWGIGAMIVGGVALMIASFFFPEHRKWMLIAGIGLIVAAVVLWIVLLILAVVLRSKTGGGRSTGGGFSSSGGFGSGGFSGGGGASGRW